MIEDTLVSVDEIAFLLAEHSSEVSVVLKVNGLRASESLESLIAANFTKRSHLESTHWDNLTFFFDSVDGICKAIKLSHSFLSTKL